SRKHPFTKASPGDPMFGKPYSEYVRYQMPFLIATTVIGLARLGLSLGGQPNSVVKYFSMTVVGFIGIFYYALTVRRSGFGTYKHMIPMIFNQGMIAHIIAVIGIALSANGHPNVFDAPEFRGPGDTSQVTPMTHALAHIFLGSWAGTLVGWIVGCVVMAVGGGRKK
ncbi:MAG: hypothetical protein ABI672_06775, partial [Vicinamibacteria bacterium]